jgi:hypothetical protein
MKPDSPLFLPCTFRRHPDAERPYDASDLHLVRRCTETLDRLRELARVKGDTSLSHHFTEASRHLAEALTCRLAG